MLVRYSQAPQSSIDTRWGLHHGQVRIPDLQVQHVICSGSGLNPRSIIDTPYSMYQLLVYHMYPPVSIAYIYRTRVEPGMYVYIYIYIVMCIYVCVSMCKSIYIYNYTLYMSMFTFLYTAPSPGLDMSSTENNTSSMVGFEPPKRTNKVPCGNWT